MDNTKTGALIRELRKEKDMTQRDLADVLCVTDKAVSKWERGLCAPDISLLEPLSGALGVSVIALIGGERIAQIVPPEDREAGAKTVLAYARDEIRRKVKTAHTKSLGMAAACVAIVMLILGFALWREGYFFILDKSISPDGAFSIAVYDKALAGVGFSGEDATSIIVRAKDRNRGEWRTTYGDCTYLGTWWAPDSKKYVIALRYPDGVRLALIWLERNAESNLSAYLSMGVGMTEIAKYEMQSGEDRPWPEMEYQFLQWSSDSTSMLLYYSFWDANQQLHSGYFWYHCEDGVIHAPFGLEM